MAVSKEPFQEVQESLRKLNNVMERKAVAAGRMQELKKTIETEHKIKNPTVKTIEAKLKSLDGKINDQYEKLEELFEEISEWLNNVTV